MRRGCGGRSSTTIQQLLTITPASAATTMDYVLKDDNSEATHCISTDGSCKLTCTTDYTKSSRKDCYSLDRTSGEGSTQWNYKSGRTDGYVMVCPLFAPSARGALGLPDGRVFRKDRVLEMIGEGGRLGVGVAQGPLPTTDFCIKYTYNKWSPLDKIQLLTYDGTSNTMDYFTGMDFDTVTSNGGFEVRCVGFWGVHVLQPGSTLAGGMPLDLSRLLFPVNGS
ncbi:hypothetical protein CYMTET_33089 [Cymbomonas tetramitiformis]|uniref:Uncharacterized protein n=1 Tax=Cymbomonas tetramitiformis TaxID=36881 RepID=A0AAE0KRK1_9CHLO|nr:hypothetical protein CYMTET_33089 [Cymbomonas tetramitiformis]